MVTRVACHISELNASSDNKVDDDAEHVSFFGIARKLNQHLNFSFLSLLTYQLYSIIFCPTCNAQHRKLIFLFLLHFPFLLSLPQIQ